MKIQRSILSALLLASVAGCQTAETSATRSTDAAITRDGDGVVTRTADAKAALYPGMHGYHRAIATDSKAAQRYFDQGLTLAFGFNHDEAIRSFEEAARLDPGSPMPWWGVSYCHGMNINDRVMTPERYRAGWEAAREAKRRIDRASPAEAALVRAVVARYSWPPPAEQATLDRAYAAAMEKAWRAHPDDNDVGVLFAESLMDLQPWDYWTNDGGEKGRIGEVVATLETVLAREPNHPGATHFYIHAVEASAAPERAVAAADALQRRIPGAGHLVHMPSHIYIRVGRYSDAADANERAIRADQTYFADAPEPAIYFIYYAHNIHFLAYAAMMEGRYETAIKAARQLEAEIPEQALRDFGGLIEGIMPTTYHVLIRFGRWEEILREPQRPDYRLVSRAVHHYARSIAFSALGRPADARKEIASFDAAAAEVPDEWLIFNNRVDTVLPIARAMLDGELAFREGRHEEAFSALRRGVAMEDALIYDEPPGWMLPMRHPLGAFLMSSGRYAEAEAVYREDQRRNPGNGWSLLGLKQALEAQGRRVEAAEAGRKLAVAFARSDAGATSSCLCEPRAGWVVQANQ